MGRVPADRDSTGWAGERRRLSSDQVRQELLGTAHRLISEHGLSVGFDHIQLEELIRLANLPRSSVYRIWPNRTAFLEDLLEHLFAAAPGKGADMPERTIAGAEEQLAARQDLLATREGRGILLRELVRVVSLRNYEELRSDPDWGTYNSLLAAASGSAAAGMHDTIVRAVARTEESYVSRMAELYDRLLPILGRRMKAGLTTAQLALLGSSLSEGLARHYALRPDMVSDEIEYRQADEPAAAWQLIGIGFLQLAEGMTEDDPDSPLNRN